jgi:hypothetical protein
MRPIILFVMIALANGLAFGFLTRPTSRTLEILEAHQGELDELLAAQEESTGKLNQFSELVGTAESVLEPLVLGGESVQSQLRRAFLEAERGLGLQRETLELRPIGQPPKGFAGVRIRLIQTGFYTELVTYMDRLSRLRMPVELAEMFLVESSSGTAPLTLTAAWSAIWPEVPGREESGDGKREIGRYNYPEGVNEEAFPLLLNWLKADGVSPGAIPSRDIFRKGARPAAASVSAIPATSESVPDEPAGVERPRLTGFVFRGGTLKGPRASIWFEDQTWLVGVGELVGPFRVDEMVAGENVTLVHQESGETLKLSIK